MATDVFPFAVWLSGTNQNSIPANDNALRVQVITGPALSIVSAQPASPTEGDQHILGAAPTGAQWATFAEDDVVIFKGGTWLAFEPYQGWLKFNADDGETYQWDSGWTVFAGGGGGGGAAWGSIVGTLSDQADLQAVLDAKASTAYVDNLIQGLSWKKAVRAATTANGTLATAFENGDAIDGVTLATGDRILLKNQTTGSENGIYTVNASGAPTRAADADTGAEMVNATVFISEGTTLADTQWTCSTNGPITIGSTTLAFVQLSGGTGFANPMTTVGDIITGGASGSPQRLAAATNGWVLTLVSGAPAWAAASGGVTGYTSSLNTASPNATANVSALVASGGSSNQFAALVPKGSGGVIAAIPDSTATGGNARGASSVDLQSSRSGATQVASGSAAVIGGGSQNTASGTNAVVPGGASNTATADYSAVLSGQSNLVTATRAHITGGFNNSCDGVGARAGGSGTDTRGVAGADVFGSNQNGIGLFQRGLYTLQRQTTNATPVAAVAADQAATPTTGNQITLKNSSSYAFTGLVVARDAAGDTKKWKFEGGINRGASAATAALDAAVTPTVLGSTGTVTGWDVSVTANTTLGCLSVTVTGAASTTIWWTVFVSTAEVCLS